MAKREREKKEDEEARKKHKEALDASEILKKYHEGRWRNHTDRVYKIQVPQYNRTLDLMRSDDCLSYAFCSFLHEVGWVATHLMLVPYTEFPVITEQTIRQSLETIVHPKNWSENSLHNIIPEWPAPYEPKYLEQAMYVGKNLKGKYSNEERAKAQEEEAEERKRLEGQEDPDGLIRLAADAGTYLCQLQSGISISGFSGHIAANKKDFDEEKDKEREPVQTYCLFMCAGSRELFEQLTPGDKDEIDSILGPGYGDLPAILDSPLMKTGAEEFDKICPPPPPEYRLNACDMMAHIETGMMKDRCGWAGVDPPILTPKAVVILTAAVSAVLHKTMQSKRFEKEARENMEEAAKTVAEEEEVAAAKKEEQEDGGGEEDLDLAGESEDNKIAGSLKKEYDAVTGGYNSAEGLSKEDYAKKRKLEGQRSRLMAKVEQYKPHIDSDSTAKTEYQTRMAKVAKIDAKIDKLYGDDDISD